eukprot:3811629-Prymnesium_polylepis.2
MNHMVPTGLEVAKVSPLDGVRPREMLLFNAYEVKSAPWMRGSRVDIQTFVRNKETGTAHLMVLDVLTDTRSWDPINGLTGPNYVVTMKESPGIDVHFDGVDRFCVKGRPGNLIYPNYTFIVEANRKCYFGNFRKGYTMDFKEEEIMQPVTELHNVKIENTCWKEFRGGFITAFKHNTPMEFESPDEKTTGGPDPYKETLPPDFNEKLGAKK